MSVEGKTFLIVDDVANMREVIGAVVENAGGTFSEASSESTMLESLQKGDLPDVLLLDLNLPEGSGLRILKKIRAIPRTDKLKICFVSGDRSESTVRCAISMGAYDYIVKPIDPLTLARKLATFFSANDENEKSFHRAQVQIAASFPHDTSLPKATIVAVSEIDLIMRSSVEMKADDALLVRVPSFAAEIQHPDVFHLRVISSRKLPNYWEVRCAWIGLHESISTRIRRFVMSAKSLRDADAPAFDEVKAKKGASKR